MVYLCLLTPFSKQDQAELYLEQYIIQNYTTIAAIYNENEEKGTQALLGHHMIFRGYIVKNWFGTTTTDEKYHDANKIFVKESVLHYSKCWRDRNDVAASPRKKRERTLTQYKNFIRQHEFGESKMLRKYIRNRSTQMENSSTENIQNWIISAQKFKKNARNIKPNDIRQYFQRK